MKGDWEMMVMVCGLPGTGKTRFSRSLAERLKAVHLNTDRLRGEMNLKGQYTPEARKRVYEAMLDRTAKNFLRGKDVVLDGTFQYRTLRERFIQKAAEYNHRFYCIEILAEWHTVKARLREKREHSEADFGVYRKVKSRFEPLETRRLRLRSDTMPVSEMVGAALEYIHGQKRG